jgi:hypothetical protein
MTDKMESMMLTAFTNKMLEQGIAELKAVEIAAQFMMIGYFREGFPRDMIQEIILPQDFYLIKDLISAWI